MGLLDDAEALNTERRAQCNAEEAEALRRAGEDEAVKPDWGPELLALLERFDVMPQRLWRQAGRIAPTRATGWNTVEQFQWFASGWVIGLRSEVTGYGMDAAGGYETKYALSTDGRFFTFASTYHSQWPAAMHGFTSEAKGPVVEHELRRRDLDRYRLDIVRVIAALVENRALKGIGYITVPAM